MSARRSILREQPAEVSKEPRWPGAVAVVSVGLLNLFLPASLSAGPGWLAVGAVAALAISALLIERWHVWLGHAAAAVATFELGYSLWVLVRDLTEHRGHPTDILRAALLLWSILSLVVAWRVPVLMPAP